MKMGVLLATRLHQKDMAIHAQNPVLLASTMESVSLVNAGRPLKSNQQLLIRTPLPFKVLIHVLVMQRAEFKLESVNLMLVLLR